MDDLYSLIPVIKRARGYRLYAFSGKRYLDLYLGGGHNLFGHKPAQYVNHLKQAAERGAIADLPSIYTRRVRKALRTLFPDYRTFLLAPSLPELFERAGLVIGQPLSAADLGDPLFPSKNSSGAVSVWRPYCPDNVMTDLLLPIIPSGFGPALHVLCVKSEASAGTEEPGALSALVLAGASYCLTLLAATALPDWYRPDLLAGAPAFRQHGPYLVPRFSAAAYPALFARFLDEGLVLSPYFRQPSILPLELSGGELKNLVTSFMNEGGGI